MSDILKIIAKNKKAFFKYEIIDKYEAGVSLMGSEVKSLRESKCSLDEAYAKLRDGELYLVGMHVSEYQPAGKLNHQPTRPRKLLLHRNQLNRLVAKVNERGFTVIPTMIYFKTNGLVKVEIALVRGRAKYDQREKIKEKEVKKRLRRFRE